MLKLFEVGKCHMALLVRSGPHVEAEAEEGSEDGRPHKRHSRAEGGGKPGGLGCAAAWLAGCAEAGGGGRGWA